VQEPVAWLRRAPYVGHQAKSADALLQEADRLLYEAKHNGCDRVLTRPAQGSPWESSPDVGSWRNWRRSCGFA